MCGFVGLRRWDGGPVDGDALVRASELLHHRGPDGHGVVVDGPFGVAHRRLAIIDPSSSPQPMSSPDGSVHLAFNGEILNYRDVRSTLEYPFVTNGDTEVLLALHTQRLSPSVAPLLRGQFAYAVHDGRTGETWLTRDRLGILPLYYAVGPGWLAFASESKALLPFLDEARIDEASLDAYLRRRSVPAPDTLLQGVRKLLPGHVARIGPDGAWSTQQYWSAAAVAPIDVTEPEATRLLDEALGRAVDANLVADVPVGAYLSGGLDSSLITALTAERVGRGSLHTFSAGFGDERLDETSFASLVADRLGTLHHQVDVRPDDFAAHWEDLTWHRDAPLSEPADVAVYLLARAASEHVKVVLSGEGADEVFAGYPKYRLAGLSAAPWPAPARRVFSAAEDVLPGRLRRGRIALRAMSAPTVRERFEAWFSPFTAEERARLLGPSTGRPTPDPVPDDGSALHRMLVADCGPWLADNLLERGDRMTMAASVELRPPFLDHHVVELGLAMPDRVKLRRGTGKTVVRSVAADRLPPSVLTRPKSGFRVPLDRWFRGGLRDLARDLLLAPDSVAGTVLERPEVQRLLDRHEAGGSDESIRIWTLVGLEVWRRQFIGPDRRVAVGVARPAR